MQFRRAIPCSTVVGKWSWRSINMFRPLPPESLLRLANLITLCLFYLTFTGFMLVVIFDCKTVGFFLKIRKEIGKAWCKGLACAKRASERVRREKKNPVSPQSRSLFSASFQTFCLTARAYLNTQKYGLFCSLLLYICF